MAGGPVVDFSFGVIDSEAQGNGKVVAMVQYLAQGGFIWHDNCNIIYIYKEAGAREFPAQGGMENLINHVEQGGG